LQEALKFLTTAGATGTDPLLVGAKVGLFSGSPNLTVATVIGDLTEAVYTGYARQSLGTLSAQYTDDNGDEQRDSALLTFAPSGSTTGDVITGWFLVDSGGTMLLGAEYLDSPKTMSGADDHLPIVISPTMPLGTILGQSTQVI